jgi:hypothetical protein
MMAAMSQQPDPFRDFEELGSLPGERNVRKLLLGAQACFIAVLVLVSGLFALPHFFGRIGECRKTRRPDVD